MGAFVGIHMSAGLDHVEAEYSLVQVVVAVAFDEGHIVIVGVAAMSEADLCNELVRLGNLIDAFEISAAVHEGERLSRVVRPLSHDRHVFGVPTMTAFKMD